ncbi:hypothetical protein BJY52DRAFT_1258095 [Lactarius psammicola]|nr:hypothetical protein BJY52DRAFT_1258095 [Lactarius psammicola]
MWPVCSQSRCVVFRVAVVVMRLSAITTRAKTVSMAVPLAWLVSLSCVCRRGGLSNVGQRCMGTTAVERVSHNETAIGLHSILLWVHVDQLGPA